MDFDYNTVKYLVIILSLLILGYICFLIYTDLSTVRSECTKLKTKLFETSDSLTELQKQIEYVSADADSDTEIDEEEHTLQDILNNQLFTSGKEDYHNEEIDPESQRDSLFNRSPASIESIESPIEQPINSFSFNIPFFGQEQPDNKITEVNDEPEPAPEIPVVPYNEQEDIQFLSTSNQCEGTIASGKNKGKQCSKEAIADSKYCAKHGK